MVRYFLAVFFFFFIFCSWSVGRAGCRPCYALILVYNSTILIKLFNSINWFIFKRNLAYRIVIRPRFTASSFFNFFSVLLLLFFDLHSNCDFVHLHNNYPPQSNWYNDFEPTTNIKQQQTRRSSYPLLLVHLPLFRRLIEQPTPKISFAIWLYCLRSTFAVRSFVRSNEPFFVVNPSTHLELCCTSHPRSPSWQNDRLWIARSVCSIWPFCRLAEWIGKVIVWLLRFPGLSHSNGLARQSHDHRRLGFAINLQFVGGHLEWMWYFRLDRCSTSFVLYSARLITSAPTRSHSLVRYPFVSTRSSSSKQSHNFQTVIFFVDRIGLVVSKSHHHRLIKIWRSFFFSSLLPHCFQSKFGH